MIFRYEYMNLSRKHKKMEHIIKLTLNEFNEHAQAGISYQLNVDMKSGKMTTRGSTFDFVYRSEVRIADVERWKEHFKKKEYCLIARKIYANAKARLKESGIYFFEYDGSYYLETRDRTYYREKVNTYDQRSNPTRLNGKYGSRVLLALIQEERLLEQDITETASKLQMGVSTLYYYYSEYKKLGILEKLSCTDYRESLLSFTYQNVYVRNYDSTWLGTSNVETLETSAMERIKESSKIIMAWEGIEEAEEIELTSRLIGYDREYAVLTNPYSRRCCRIIRNNFREGFNKWVDSRQFLH